jgi:PAS domain S-box-containing protein
LQLTSSLDLPTVLDSVAQSAQALVGASDCLIYVYDEQIQSFSFGTARGRWAETGAVVAPRPDGLTATVARKVRPVIIDDATDHPLYASPEAQAWNIQAIAGFPLQWAGRVLGVLHVIFVQPHTFSLEEQRALEALADRAASAIENARLFEATRTQLEELKVLHAVATAGAEATKEDVLIERVTHIIGETLYPADIFGVILLDEAAGLLRIHPSYQVAEELEHMSQAALERFGTEGLGQIAVRLGQGITGTVAASGEPCREGDVTRVPQYMDAGIGTKSELCVPIKIGERVIGVINAESRQPEAFNEADERLMATVAGQLATAIERVRLYEATRTQLEELKVLHAVATAGAEATVEDVLIERVTQIIGETLYPADIFGVMLLDAEAGLVHIHPSYQVAEEFERIWQAGRERLGIDDEGQIVVPLGQGITGMVAASGKPCRAGDVTRVPQYMDAGIGTKSELCVPIKVGERVIGVINAESRQTDAFSEADERLLATVAGQLATAIERVRLYEAAQQEIAERKQAEEELRRLKEFNEGIIQNMVEGIFVLDASGYFTFVNPASAAMLGYEFDELAGQHWTAVVPPDQQPVVEAADERRTRGESDRYELELVRKDGARVPTQVSGSPRLDPHTGQLLGTMGVFVDLTERVQAEEELRKHRDNLEELVEERTADLAESNAQLQREIEERTRAEAEREHLLAAERAQAQRQAALLHLSAELAATLDEAEVSRRVVNGLHATLDYDYVALFLQDETTGDRVPAADTGPLEPPGRIPPGQGLSERPLLDGRLHYTPDVRQDPRYIHWMGGSEVDVPIRIGGQVRGVLVAENEQPDAFTQHDLEVLMAAAQQAGLAIESARLYAQAERRAAQAALAFEVGRRVSGELELEALLSEVATVVQHAFDYYGVMLLLLDEEAESLTLEAIAGGYVGILPQGFQIATGKGMTGHAARTGETQISGDVSQDPHYIRIAEEETQSELAVPIKSGQKVIGVLDLQSTEIDAFDAIDVLLMETLADQIAVAIENAWLYDQAQQEIAERVRAEEELRTYHERLEELVQARTAELRASEARYRTLFDGVPVGLYRSTPAGQMVDANLALVQMLGFESREDFLARADAAGFYVDPDVRVRWQALMEREGLVRDFEFQHLRRDGTVIWAKDTARAVKDEQGQVLYYEGSLEDITERKQAEEELRTYQEHLEDLVEERTAELRESEERYRTLFDGVPVGLYRATHEGQLLDVNLATVHMLGYPDRGDWLGAIRTADVYVDPNERVRWQALMEREGLVRDFEFQGRRSDGTVIWINDTARAVRDEQGQVLHYEGSLEDISERKRIEGELRRQKEYYEALFVNSPVAVATTDLDIHVVSWNPEAERLFGYTREEAIGRNLDDLVASDPRVRQEALEYTAQVSATVRVQATTKRMRKDGSLVDVETLALPVIVGDRKVGYIGIYVDITALQEARREAEAANQAKSTFLANMSHELRTPLNAIMGFTRLVKRRSRDLLPEKQLDNLDKVLTSADHLLELINAILDLSKIEAGRIEVLPTTFNLEAVVDVCLQTVRPLVNAEQIQLVKEVEPDLPPLLTDQDKVRQILINLLSNAVKFTEEGTISVHALRRGDMLSLKVADTGIGIPDEALERIFEPFQQVDSGTTRRYGGTGLGLSISRHLAQLLGGDLTVESTVGVGSTFTVTIPMQYVTAAPAPTITPRAELPSAPATAGPDEGPLVLAIDDDPNVIILLQENLSEEGYRVVGANDGQEGLRKARALQPHAILLDILMSPKDGWQVLHELKADEATRDIPVVVLSIVENRELGYRLGASDYLMKPFDREAILGALTRLAPVREEERPADLLVVDDDPQVIDLVRQLLEGEPYAVRAAADGQEALDAVAGQLPDIMLLDLLMPRLDGFGVIAQLQQDPAYRDIPIIILTAKTLSAEELSQLQQRVTRVVQKRALERDVLIRELRRALRAYRQGGDPTG